MSRQSQRVVRAKRLRQTLTTAEGLLWSLLRSKQLSGLKFRRQHPIGPYFVDFACPSHRAIVELDGGYHDQVAEQDLRRQRDLEQLGWRVIRFSNNDVREDAEAVLQAITRVLGVPYDFRKRSTTGSGQMNDESTNAATMRAESPEASIDHFFPPPGS